MTTMKKLFALMLAVLMLLSVCAVAEEDDYNIDNHTFTAYQIFSGKQGESTDGSEAPLTDIGWGDGINDGNFLAALKEENAIFMKKGEGETSTNIFASCTTAQDVADVLAGYNDNSEVAKKFAQIAYQNKKGEGTAIADGVKLDSGYYLIADMTSFGEGATGTAYNAALLQVTDSIEIQVKTSVPTVEKKVKDVNDSKADSTTEWQDSADYDVGDEIPYQLTATLGNELGYFDSYTVKFVDDLSNGLTFEEITSVKIGEKELTLDDYESICDENNILTITIDDVLALGAKGNDIIVVEYTATLNEQAIIGSEGNPNTVYLEYSNNPNNTSSMGKTKEDKVTVFTYKVVVDKVDQDDVPLSGAEFKLEKYDGTDESNKEVWTEIKASDPVVAEPTSFEFKGLDDGTYRLTETKTPAGYNTIEPITFVVTASHDEKADEPKLTALSGDKLTGEITLTRDTTNDDALKATIINKSGALLPETGGIGTTIFYVAGGVLVLLAVVLLVTKRRVGENN